jgi:hypothetical protein
VNKHDFSSDGCEPKQQTRIDTLDVIRTKGLRLWSRQHRCLGRDHLELTALGDPMLRLMLDQEALRPGFGRYIGVNGPNPYDSKTDPEAAEAAAREILRANAAEFDEATSQGLVEWRYGLLEDVLAERNGLDNVGVLVADGQYILGDHQIGVTHAPCFRFALDQKKRLGQFLLVINLVYRGASDRPLDKALTVWSRTLAQCLGLPRAVPTANFTVYRNAGARLPMCLCRVLL